MALHKIDAYPETCSVQTRQKSKTVWLATGDFQGKHLEEKGRTEQAALRAWKEIAEWRYRCS